MRSTRTPAIRQPSVLYASIGALARRPDSLTGQQMMIVVARRRHSAEWIGGVARMLTTDSPHVVQLTDGRRLVVGDLRPEAQMDSYQADLMVEAVIREHDIEMEVEQIFGDPGAMAELLKRAGELYPGPA